MDSLLFWFLAGFGVILTGISKSGFAAGAGVIATPLLALVVPVHEAVFLVLPVLIIMDIKILHYYWKNINFAELKQIIPASMIGVLFGALLLGRLPLNVLQIILGFLCIVFALWHKLSNKLGQMKTSGWIWGIISGITSTLIHSGGPPINIHFVSRNLPKLVWLATVGMFFFVMNTIKIVPYLMTGKWEYSTFINSLLLFPFAFVGVWLGKIVQNKIDENIFSLCCRFLLFVSGLILLIKAIIY